MTESGPLWHTIKINVPDHMIVRTKKGRVSVKKTLTKKFQIASNDGKPAIQIVPVKQKVASIVEKGTPVIPPKTKQLIKPDISFKEFSKKVRPEIVKEHPGMKFGDISKEIGARWRKLTGKKTTMSVFDDDD